MFITIYQTYLSKKFFCFIMIIVNLTTSLIIPNYFIGCMFRPLWYIEHLLLRVSNQAHQSIHPPKPSQPNWKLFDPMLAMVSNGSLPPWIETNGSIDGSSHEKLISTNPTNLHSNISSFIALSLSLSLKFNKISTRSNEVLSKFVKIWQNFN